MNSIITVHITMNSNIALFFMRDIHIYRLLVYPKYLWGFLLLWGFLYGGKRLWGFWFLTYCNMGDIPYFVFGTLRNDGCFQTVTGVKPKYTSATLHGYIKSGLNILEQDGASVEGDIVYCNPIVIAHLDHYEGVHKGYYHTIDVTVTLENGEKLDCKAYQLTNSSYIMTSPYLTQEKSVEE